MRYVYILLLGLIIYYIISRFYEKYTENFDPSLVPVSSIITLAKVAQKLVDGNGTLTNPGNLQIGTPSAVGNLLVTGDTIVSGRLANIGITQLGSTLGVTGATSLSSTLGVTGATTLSSTLGVTGATTLTGATTIGASGTPATTTNLTVNGATKITGDTTIGGTLNFTNAGTFTINQNGNKVVECNNGGGFQVKDSIFVSNLAPTGNPDWATKIDAAGNITAKGTVKSGNLTIGNTTINETDLKHLIQIKNYWRDTVDEIGQLIIKSYPNVIDGKNAGSKFVMSKLFSN